MGKNIVKTYLLFLFLFLWRPQLAIVFFMHSLQIINSDVPIIFITILIITVKAQGLVKAKFVSKKVKMFLYSKMQIEL